MGFLNKILKHFPKEKCMVFFYCMLFTHSKFSY